MTDFKRELNSQAPDPNFTILSNQSTDDSNGMNYSMKQRFEVFERQNTAETTSPIFGQGVSSPSYLNNLTNGQMTTDSFSDVTISKFSCSCDRLSEGVKTNGNSNDQSYTYSQCECDPSKPAMKIADKAFITGFSALHDKELNELKDIVEREKGHFQFVK